VVGSHDSSGLPLARIGKVLTIVNDAGGREAKLVQWQKPRVLIVDDEPELRDMVAEYLGKHGFVVTTAAGGHELDALLADNPPDLLILDVNMPGEDGFAIARRVRATSNVPIVMLTAADGTVDRVVGLELGADDYLAKPFDLRELRARIQAVLRRTGRTADPAPRSTAPRSTAPPTPESSLLVRMGELLLDLDGRRLLQPDGAELPLTAMEFDLLAAFARNPNRALSRERLLDLAHGRDNEPFDRSIDVRITRIRRKLERDPARPQIIKTVHGVGYMFVPPKP
jgi:DNA-binding response OmpR family regulator